MHLVQFLLRCCTKADAEGISGDESNISISSFVAFTFHPYNASYNCLK